MPNDKNIKGEYTYDVAVVGAGPAGMMAAGKAAESGAKVVLLEKNVKLGAKIFLTGNGRCNLTNAEFDLRKLVENYPANGDFLFHALSVFGPREVIDFFDRLGLKIKIEETKRVFPVTDKAQDVVEALKKYLSDNKVDILYNSEVVDVVLENRKIEKLILKDGEVSARSYILCTGGRSYPLTGSTGQGYALATKLGHNVKKATAGLAPIKIIEDWVKELQGLGFKNVKISIFQNDKKQFSEDGDILFTHFGLSGPAILNASGRLGELLEKAPVKISIDLNPLIGLDELSKKFQESLIRNPKKTFKNILADFIPERLAEVFIRITGVSEKEKANDVTKIKKMSAGKLLKSFEIAVDSVSGIDQAIVTNGGISIKEIDGKTMKSKMVDNLFFAGEIIDVYGKTGGFNLQMCWSTGYLAGQSSIKL